MNYGDLLCPELAVGAVIPRFLEFVAFFERTAVFWSCVRLSMVWLVCDIGVLHVFFLDVSLQRIPVYLVGVVLIHLTRFGVRCKLYMTVFNNSVEGFRDGSRTTTIR